MIGIAASISTAATGFLFNGLGHVMGFIVLAGIAVAAAAVCWAYLPETKPAQYID